MEFINNFFVNIAGLIRWVFDWLLGLLGLPLGLTDVLMVAVYWVAIVIVCVLCALFYVIWERKLAGYIQRRPGPNRLGPNCWLQTIGDAIKLVMKEDIVPDKADKPVHLLAALLAFVPPMLALAAIPFGEGMAALDLQLGVVYVIAVTTLASLPVLLAGYASNNKYSLVGGMRVVNQAISYEVPQAFAILSVIMVAGTFNLTEIVHFQQQHLWLVCVQPLAFVIYIISAVAECNRAPFDLPEGESELTAGVFTEYSGMRYALFYLAEYCNMFVAAGLATTLFLGGFSGPFLPGWLWFILKTFVIMSIFIWVRWTLPRVRADYVLRFCWKLLVPLTLLNMLVTGVVLYILA